MLPPNMRRSLSRNFSRFSFFKVSFFSSYVLPNTTCASHDFVHVSVFSFALIRPPNMQSWRLQSRDIWKSEKSRYRSFTAKLYAYRVLHRGQISRHFRDTWYARVKYRLGVKWHQADILCCVSWAKSRNGYDEELRAYQKHTDTTAAARVSI